MELSPYLLFDGNCAEAFKFYAQCLGGKIVMMQTHGESPMKDQVSPDWRDKIIHAQLTVGSQSLMGSDAPPEHVRAGRRVSRSRDSRRRIGRSGTHLQGALGEWQGSDAVPEDVLVAWLRHGRRSVRHSLDGELRAGSLTRAAALLRRRDEGGVIGRCASDRSRTRDGQRRLSLRLAARACHADSAARRLRSRRGSAARCVPGRAGTMAARRRAGQSARLAGVGRTLQGASTACGAVPASTRSTTWGQARMSAVDDPARMGGRRERRRRPAAADFHLLPSGAVAGRAGRADAARGVRADDRGNRPGLPRRRRRRWRSASCAPRRRFATRGSPTRCRRRPSCPSGSTRCCG